jgi:DNA topoisomerase VI subunit B
MSNSTTAPALAEERRPTAGARLLERTVFVTARAMDFLSQKELVAQTGHEAGDWPLVVLKELVDNGIDACEEAGVAPIIAVQVSENAITVTDNGHGMSEGVIRDIGNFDVRVSAREAYVAPDRGKQGNALNTLLAMPFVLDGSRGLVTIEANGIAHTVHLRLDRIAQKPFVQVEAATSDVRTGTSVTVHWPDSACSNLIGAKARFLQTAQDYAWLNPHLAVRVSWYGQVVVDLAAHRPAWPKWKPHDPTSPHWYAPEHLSRLIGAHLHHQNGDGNGMTIREYVSSFRGLSGTAKQKAVTDSAELTGAKLSDLVVGGEIDKEAVRRLLAAMQAESREVSPAALGALGREHLSRCLEADGYEPDTFQYRKAQGTEDGVPWIVELAFAVHRSAFVGCDEEPRARRLVAGVNWSPGIANPFSRLKWVDRSNSHTMDSILSYQKADADSPVAVVIHLACPRVEYTDRGKAGVAIPLPMRNAMGNALYKAAERWGKQCRAEERESSAAARREDRLMRCHKGLNQIEAAAQVMESAYMAASTNGTLPAHARQVMYQARGPMQELTGKALGNGFDQYFCQTLLPNYMAANPETTEKWDVVFDARGNLVEPHTNRVVPLGTLDVRYYLRTAAEAGEVSDFGEVTVDAGVYPTCGPANRYQAILFVEKEGFNPLFEAVHLADRYDLAIMSTKGMSVTACRLLIDRLCAEDDITILALHDFDKAGLSILHTLSRSTRRYDFTNKVRVIDLGLRLKDVKAQTLPAEDVVYGKTDPTANLVKNGATKKEVAFLYRGHNVARGGHWGQRVELNAFTSAAFIKWIEAGLQEHGIRKTIPDEAVLDHAFRRAAAAYHFNAHSRRAAEAARAHAAGISIPGDLRGQVERRLRATPEISWDQAIGQIVTEGDVCPPLAGMATRPMATETALEDTVPLGKRHTLRSTSHDAKH